MAKRRFIAGAVCPNCRALDRLVVEQLADGTSLRQCVACGFSDTTATTAGFGVPRGRPEQSAARKDAPSGPPVVETSPAQVVKIIDPKQN